MCPKVCWASACHVTLVGLKKGQYTGKHVCVVFRAFSACFTCVTRLRYSNNDVSQKVISHTFIWTENPKYWCLAGLGVGVVYPKQLVSGGCRFRCTTSTHTYRKLSVYETDMKSLGRPTTSKVLVKRSWYGTLYERHSDTIFQTNFLRTDAVNRKTPP